MELITGNKFKKMCHYSLDEFGFIKHVEPDDGEILKIFVKIDFVHQFFCDKQNVPFILITHNGDISISDVYLKYLEEPNLISWYGQNINTIHFKLKSIPIGIANEKWPHGNESIFLEVIKENNLKENLIYVNFDVNTNRNERGYCLTEINKQGLSLEQIKPFKEYLQDVSKSYFVISPNGNGIDCHKTWEALYLKTIPIVTKSINIEYYKDLPILIISDWSNFNIKNINIELYNKIWDDFNPIKLTINNFLTNE